MADETLVINLKIDATQSAKTIEELTKRNKELAKAIRQAPREGQEGYEELNEELKQAQKEFARNREEIIEFNRALRETEVADDSLKGLSRQLRKLEKEYKSLGKAAREDAFGKRLQTQIKSTRNQLKKLEGDLGDARRNVGNYGKAWQKAGSRIAGIGNLTGIGLIATLAVEGIKNVVMLTSRFEELRGKIVQATGASGELLDQLTIDVAGIANAFGAETDAIVDAARTLSNELEIEFEDAIGVIEKGFVAGADSSGNFLSSLENLSGEAAKAGVSAESFTAILQQAAVNGVEANEELIKSFADTTTGIDDLIDASDQATQVQIQQLEASKQLAETQNDLAGRLSGSGSQLKLLGTNILEFVFDALNRVIDIASPVVEAFKALFAALGRLTQSFTGAKKEGSFFKTLLDAVAWVLGVVGKAITAVVNAVTWLVDGIKSFIDESPFLQKVIAGIGKAFTTIRSIIGSIPAVFTGLVAAAKQAGTNISNFFKGIVADVKFTFALIKAANPFAKTNKDFKESLKEAFLDLKKTKDQIAEESIGVFEAFGNAFDEAMKAQDELTENATENIEKTATELEQSFSGATKKGVDDANKELDKLGQVGSLKRLSEVIKPLKAEFEKLAVGSDEFKKKLEELKVAEEALAEAEKAVKEARESDAERKARLDKELEDRIAANKALEEEARQAAIDQADAAQQATILQLSRERNTKLQNAELTTKERLAIEAEFEAELLRLTIETEKERQAILEEGSEEQIASKQAVIDAELQLLNLQIEQEKAASEERIDIISKEEQEKLELKKASEKAAFDVAQTFADLAFNLARQRAENTKNEELKAVRDEFAEKLQLAQGNAAEEELLKKQQAEAEANIEQKAAEKKKALALVQAVINGALAALQTMANLGYPLAIPALIAVAATTAANIATIASQKFEKGGIAKKRRRRMAGGGIAPGRRHADGGTMAVIGGQEVVEIEVGEGITNRKSTKRFLQTLSDINQAGGGVRYEGTAPLTSRRLAALSAFELMSQSMPTIAERGLSPRLSRSVRRTFQAGGVSSVQSAAASIGQEVEFQGRILTNEDVALIAKAAAEGTKAGIEAADLFGQFRRQAERQINQNNRSKV